MVILKVGKLISLYRDQNNKDKDVRRIIQDCDTSSIFERSEAD